MNSEIWLRNFKNSVTELIKVNRDTGYTVKGLVMTVGIYEKLTKAIGYEPTEFIGYTVEILDQTEAEFIKEGEMVFVKGDALN